MQTGKFQSREQVVYIKPLSIVMEKKLMGCLYAVFQVRMLQRKSLSVMQSLAASSEIYPWL
jgi:hypothetical protein